MNTTITSDARKGITPVVAIVLLLMLTIVAVGGMWAWTQDVLQGGMDDADDQLKSGLEFVSLSCLDNSGSADQLKWTLKNAGKTDLDMSDVDVYVYKVSDGELLSHDSASRANPLTSTDRHWYRGVNGEPPFDISGDMTSGNHYEVQVESANAEVSASSQCQAR